MFQVFGRLHPLVVHFPIALLIAAALCELSRARRSGPSQAGFVCLLLGAAGALVAASTGWSFAEHDPPGAPGLLLRHRWTGVAVAAVAAATALSAWRWKRGAALATPTRLGLACAALLVGYSAHLGGALVYGEGFVLEPLREALPDAPVPESARADATRAASASGEPEVEVRPALQASTPEDGNLAPGQEKAPTDAPVDYSTQIRPIFEERCFECHGERRRPKGKLKLADIAAVLARDPQEAVIRPGDPEGSPLFERITLPADDEDVMPPEDGPLTSAQIELIREWIAQGAHAPESKARASAGDAEPAPRPEAEFHSTLTPAERATRDEALAQLRALGARAMTVSRSSDEVEVDLSLADPPAGDAALAGLAGLEPTLVHLVLSRSAVSDAGLAALARCSRLTHLRLDHTAIGDAGLAHLGGLGELVSLNLFHTRVGDAGLAHLKSLAKLERLYLGETAVSAAAVAELRAALPDCSIDLGPLPSFAPAVPAPKEGR